MTGDELREARQKCGISQDDLARLSGISVQTISSFEVGRQQPRRLTLHVLIEAIAEVAPRDKLMLSDERPDATSINDALWRLDALAREHGNDGDVADVELLCLELAWLRAQFI